MNRRKLLEVTLMIRVLLRRITVCRCLSVVIILILVMFLLEVQNRGRRSEVQLLAVLDLVL